jgi:hypothetical protein
MSGLRWLLNGTPFIVRFGNVEDGRLASYDRTAESVIWQSRTNSLKNGRDLPKVHRVLRTYGVTLTCAPSPSQHD